MRKIEIRTDINNRLPVIGNRIVFMTSYRRNLSTGEIVGFTDGGSPRITGKHHSKPHPVTGDFLIIN